MRRIHCILYVCSFALQREGHWCGKERNRLEAGWFYELGTDGYWQIGFLTEWQLYAQKLEGDNWVGEKLDKSKLDKMSGMLEVPVQAVRIG